MPTLQNRLKAFVKLGALFREFSALHEKGEVLPEGPLFQKLQKAVELAGHRNGWFAREQILFSLKAWGDCLKEKALGSWIAPYELPDNGNQKVALILAGNIPLVGFHDLLSVIITGNTAMVKLSSNDNVLLPAVVDILDLLVPGMKEMVRFEEERLKGFDSVIATGSNNTARYFEYYFRSKPSIIRKNRNSVAVLTGRESGKTLEALGRDIFQYYGLGCRSVSKVFVPKGYSFDLLFDGLQGFKNIIEEQKYQNNYDYNKAIYLMSEFDFLDNGFLTLKEDPGYASPIGTLFYEFYENKDSLKDKLKADEDQLQCIVAEGFREDEVPFGQTQFPALSDYADGIDTVEFLLKR